MEAPVVVLKSCLWCEAPKTLNEFAKRSTSKDGRRSECKSCMYARRAEIESDPVRASIKRDQRRKAGRKYAKKMREQRKNDPEYKAYLAKHSRLQYVRHPEKFKARIYSRRAKDPSVGKIAMSVRRARERGSEGSFTRQEWKTLCARFANRCLCCGDHSSDSKLTVDHVVPVSKGGSSYISNIQPLCLRCNTKKGARFGDFRTPGRQVWLAMPQSTFSGWCVVELFGRQTEIGYVTTDSFGDAVMFRIEIPPLTEREYALTEPQYVGSTWMAAGTKVRRPAVPGRSRLVSPGAVYSLNPCTEEAALAALERTSPRPLIAIDVPAGLIQAPEPEDEDNSLDDEDDFLNAAESRVRGEGL